MVKWAMIAVVAVLPALGCGCGSPSKANIALRKKVSDLDGQIATMKRDKEADQATIRGLQDRTGTVATLPADRLEKLVTVGSIQLTKLTGGADLNHEGGADTGVRAYVRLLDMNGDVIKAAGAFEVEVFDLAVAEKPLVAKKVFPVEGALANWYPMPLIYSFVLPVAWEKAPEHDRVLVRVTYLDELTQRKFVTETAAVVKLGAATRPGGVGEVR